MAISIKQLKAFIAIAESGSFVESSERLHLSQPALSISIRKMEEAIGGPLFARTSRHVQLSPEGRDFLPIARRLLQDWEEAFEDLGNLFNKQRGRINIAALPTLAAGFLPDVLADFHARYPNIDISVHDVLASQVEEMVQEGRADMGLSVRPGSTDSIHFTPLLDDHFIAVCPLKHPLLFHDSVPWQQLLQYPIIDLSRLSSTRQAIEQVLETYSLKMQLLCEVSQIGTAGRLVAAGLGVSALPSLSFRQISAEGLDWRPLVEPEVPRELGILTPTRTPLSAAAHAMLERIRHHALPVQEKRYPVNPMP